MNSNRIQINGVWYVKEDDTTPDLEISESDITFSMQRTWESNDWCFEATIIMKDGAEALDDHYPDPYIVVTDKRSDDREDWVDDEIDNTNFMWGVLEDNPESIDDALDIFDTIGLEEFKAFLRHLIKIGWLKK